MNDAFQHLKSSILSNKGQLTPCIIHPKRFLKRHLQNIHINFIQCFNPQELQEYTLPLFKSRKMLLSLTLLLTRLWIYNDVIIVQLVAVKCLYNNDTHVTVRSDMPRLLIFEYLFWPHNNFTIPWFHGYFQVDCSVLIYTTVVIMYPITVIIYTTTVIPLPYYRYFEQYLQHENDGVKWVEIWFIKSKWQD